MQPAATFYLGLNTHFPSHQGHYGGSTGFAPPYMSHYSFTSSFSPYNNPLQQLQQQPAQSLHPRSPSLLQQHQAQQKNPTTSSLGGGRSAMSGYASCYPDTTSYEFGDTKNRPGKGNLGDNQQAQRNSSYAKVSDNNGISNNQHLKAEPSFLACPQPTMAIPNLNSCNSNVVSTSTSSSHQSTNSQSQSSSEQATTTLSTSAMAYRDQLGLRSPPITHPSPSSGSGGEGLSPSSRRSPRSPATLASSNCKFRYPSGPWTSPRQPEVAKGGCPTPHLTLSSREDTPVTLPRKTEEHPPNGDVSRVQIDDNKLNFLKSETTNKPLVSSLKTEQGDFKQDQPQMEDGQPSYSCMKSEAQSNFVKLDSPSFSGENFHKYLHEGQDQGQQMLSHQQSQAHHPLHQQYMTFGNGNNNPLIPSDTAAAANNNNNNLQPRLASSIAQHRPKDIYGLNPRGLHHAGNYHPIHGGGYYPGPEGLGPQGPPHSGIRASTVSGRMVIVSNRGGSSVKIGRRPSHLPKVLKFQDVTLPQGWIRKLKCRKHGKQAGRWDVYIYSPCGVKFASRKKLKSFFEKNNLNYDLEDFDFTPYGRHSDHNSGAQGGNRASHANTANGNRHNSSSSTSSEATHAGSSPASIPKYSPSHLAASYDPHGIMTNGFSGSSDYTSFNEFNPHMENSSNINTMDIHRGDNFSTGHLSESMGSGHNQSTLEYHSVRDHQLPLKNETNERNYLDMADFFGDSYTAVAVAAALPLHNPAIYPQTSSTLPVNSQFYGLGVGLSKC